MPRKKPAKRTTRASVSNTGLLYNEATCSAHCSQILNAYDRILDGDETERHLTILRKYGIKVQTEEELATLSDPLLDLCKEWRASNPEKGDFFNQIGKGDRLEEVLAKRLGNQINLKALRRH